MSDSRDQREKDRGELGSKMSDTKVGSERGRIPNREEEAVIQTILESMKNTGHGYEQTFL